MQPYQPKVRGHRLIHVFNATLNSKIKRGGKMKHKLIKNSADLSSLVNEVSSSILMNHSDDINEQYMNVLNVLIESLSSHVSQDIVSEAAERFINNFSAIDGVSIISSTAVKYQLNEFFISKMEK